MGSLVVVCGKSTASSRAGALENCRRDFAPGMPLGPTNFAVPIDAWRRRLRLTGDRGQCAEIERHSRLCFAPAASTAHLAAVTCGMLLTADMGSGASTAGPVMMTVSQEKRTRHQKQPWPARQIYSNWPSSFLSFGRFSAIS